MANTFKLLDKALADYYANCGRNDYYDNDGIGKFMLYVEENQFEEDDMPDDLGDDVAPEDCSYADMDDNFPLPNQPQNITSIFNVIQYCYKHNKPPNISTNNTSNKPPKTSIIKSDPGIHSQKTYNIIVKPEDLDRIEELLLQQCADLRPEQSGDSDQDEATYSIIQIGKQNNNQSLLTYLVDAFNRYRIQKRKKTLQQLKKTSWNREHLIRMFNETFKDINPHSFIQKKCTGIHKNFVSEYKPEQRNKFIDKCQSAISVFPRRLIHKPPMKTTSSKVKDSIVFITQYIFQCYTFIEQFIQQQNAPVPAQIDIVIIPKGFEMMNWSEESKEHSSDEEEPDEEHKLDVGDINKRLISQKKKIEACDIEMSKANRVMLESINKLFDSERCQRGILIIDRRNNLKKDKLYCFQPNVEGNKQKRCHCFESDATKLLSEALIQNLRICILPKCDDEKENITVNTQQPFGLTLSFHCFASNEVRVYLCYNGWGTRFFIEDVKYFIPQFFADEEVEKLKYAFEKAKDRNFATTYAQCKQKCPDQKFETFYKKLFNDNKHKSH